MPKNLILWSSILVLTAVPVVLVAPFIVRSRRQANVTEKITQVRSIPAKISKALDLSLMTKDFVTAEGPCEGGCHGGALADLPPQDLNYMVPQFDSFDNRTQAILWSYNFKPVETKRRNDLFGEDSSVVTGVTSRKGEFFFAVVSKSQIEGLKSLSFEELGHK